MEYRSYNDSPIEIRQQGNQLRISGYASVYNSPSQDLGGFIETIKPGAFDQSLSEIAAGTRDVVARFNHSGGMNVLARTANKSLELRSDSTGLHYVATLSDVQLHRDVYTMIQNGLINKSSFAFSIPDNGEQWNFRSSPATRDILKADLIDVAPVDSPAYLGTSVSARAFANAELQHYRKLLEAMKERHQSVFK